MAGTTADINAIVREVVRRLMATAELDRSPAVSGTQLRVVAPVVSLAALEASVRGGPAEASDAPLPRHTVNPATLVGRLAGVERLVIGPGSVVTPAVRDLLKECRITLSMAADGQQQPGRVAPLAVAAVGTPFDVSPLLATLANLTRVARIDAADLLRAVDPLVDRIRTGDWLGLLVTDQPAAALCLANRQPGIRAAQVFDPDAVGPTAAAVGANLLVVEPARGATAQVARIASAFCRVGIQPCPEVFRDRLGGSPSPTT
jgi:hypothetical protein